MKVLVSWLGDYVETALSAEEIADILSDIGFPNEGIAHIGEDAVIDLEITSNRGDCLGYIGVARELAAATGKELKMPIVKLNESDTDVNEKVKVEIEDADLCGRYTGRLIENVKVGLTPDWMKRRLEAIGLRSVNNVVDATNYALMETGQPPHAFDYEKITDGKIIVRRATPGERIVSIDGSQCDLQTDMLIIADSKVPVAVAGVMGGLETEVGDSTKNILLEDAYFDPVSVRTTSRALTLPSEASFRFERIVDIENIDWASQRTAQLIVQVAGGIVAKGVVDVYPKKSKQKQVTVRLSRINYLLGIEVPDDKAVSILEKLSFEPQRDGDIVKCTVPSWRSDIYREADLIEEVARQWGYNKVPLASKIEIEVAPVDKRQKLTERIGRYLNGCGFYETVNVSFIGDKTAETFSPDAGKGHLAVKDVTRKSANLLRSSLIGSLLGVIKINNNAGNKPCRVFEIADTFIPTGDELPDERTKLAAACDGDIRDLTGALEGLICDLARDAKVEFLPVEIGWAEAAAQIEVNGQQLGIAGVVSEQVRTEYGLEEITVSAAEMDFQKLAEAESQQNRFRQIPKYPAVERDLSLVIGEEVTWKEITSAIEKAGCEKLEDVTYVGIYRGQGVEAGQKSLTLTLRFRDEDGTLTHEQVDEYEKEILDNLKGRTGAVLRTA
ncbi:MAG: phenylalanine--tRNA ligase subunit beta [Sedimentisphaerales bacterium]|nr:phenylalanine--tRNA ligase subunit beta [Sedimentisphaerales bacterium]